MSDFLTETKLFVLDLDGTVYLGEQLLPGAASFIDHVRQKTAAHEKEVSKGLATSLLFFTNNSSWSVDDYITKLGRLGITISPDEMMTSADVMIAYLQAHHAGEAVCLLGTPACADQFRNAGIRLEENADICVAAFDTTLTYEKLVAFCDRLRAGALFYATHPDINCPVEGGFIPDLGAMLALLEASTGQVPSQIVGKPYAPTIEAITRRSGLPASALTFVGDRLYTDMAVAINNGARSVLVLSGETDATMLAASELKPDLVVENLSDLLKIMEKQS